METLYASQYYNVVEPTDPGATWPWHRMNAGTGGTTYFGDGDAGGPPNYGNYSMVGDDGGKLFNVQPGPDPKQDLKVRDNACPHAIVDTVASGSNNVWSSIGNLGSNSNVEPTAGRGYAAPAVTHYNNVGYHFVVGQDQHIYAITDGMSGWALTSSAARCVDNVAAYVLGTTLYVACQGADDRALWTSSSTIGGSCNGLPFSCLNTWTSSGGTLIAGPAIANVGGTITVFLPGTSRNIWRVPFGSNTGWYEYGDTTTHHVAIGDFNGGDVLAYTGTDGHGYMWRYGNGAWSGTIGLGERITDGPAVAYAPGGDVTIFAQENSGGGPMIGIHVTASNGLGYWYYDGANRPGGVYGVGATQLSSNY